MYAWSTSYTALITAAFTVVIALATIAYVVYTAKLWQETKKSADAATKAAEAANISAQAAKESADAAAILHRPLIAWDNSATPSISNEGTSRIPIDLHNFGTLSAIHLKAHFELHTESTTESRNLFFYSDLGPLEIPPQSGHHTALFLKLGKDRHMKVTSATTNLILTLKASYDTPDGREFEYTAEAKLDLAQDRFVTSKSETRDLHPRPITPR